MSATDEVICERQGCAGLITLNRPKALNALNLTMVRGMREALDAWATHPDVTRIVVTGAGERAFCAGGDIRQMHDLGRAGRFDEALTFWREEYQLNALIKRYPKPYVSLIDGIVMGGGVGVSLHGSHRVGGERYLFAMPEVGIGFFPDVGATYALPRLPGETGMYLALTGERLGLADGAYLGLVTHPVRSEAMAAIREALIAGRGVDETLRDAVFDPGPSPLGQNRAIIDTCFARNSVLEILECLDTHGSEFATRTAATMRSKSPTSMAISFEQVRRGGALSFEEAMQTEFRIVSRVIDGTDFYEGVRAVLIDKDGQPAWKPATLQELDAASVESYFAPLGHNELKVA